MSTPTETHETTDIWKIEDGILRVDRRISHWRQCIGRWETYDGWAKYNAVTGGDVSASADHPGEWDATAADIIARIPTSVRAGQPIYLRFGRLPQSGRSTNHQTGETEAGASVYHAEYDPLTGGYRFSEAEPPADFGAAILGQFRSCCLLLTGELIGAGSDGEPVIRNAEIVTRLTFDPGAGIFRAEGGNAE